jgi:hypothetical protein
MNQPGSPSREHLCRLLSAQSDGWITAEGRQELLDLLRADPGARALYAQQAVLHSLLHHKARGNQNGERGERREESEGISGQWPVVSGQCETEFPEIPTLNFQISKSPNLQISSLNSRLSTLNSWTFSYSVATLFLAVFLLGAWSYTITHPDADSLAAKSSRNATTSGTTEKEPSQFTFVGRVSGMVDCQWTEEATATSPGAGVALKRRYALKSGLMEITYDSGAKIILQGPCEYTVESPHGGYLAVGKLVARVGAGDGGRGTGETTNLPSPFGRGAGGEGFGRGAGGEGFGREVGGEGSQPRSQSALTLALSGHHEVVGEKGHSSTPHAPRPSPLFSVRTPTATIEDLGTEFGVEVSDTGETASHVFQGKVVVRIEGAGVGERGTRDDKSEIVLTAGQSARIARDAAGIAAIKNQECITKSFVRAIPRRIPVKVFSTGYRVSVGSTDPHWEIVARSDDPTFRPRRAVVVFIDPEKFLPNDYSRSQWISTDRILPDERDGVTYTFRTTFDLPDAESSPVELHGRFIVDNHVSAIRLNGRLIEVPEHGYADPFVEFHSFLINKGFVSGNNVLEIDVFNGFRDSTPDTATPLALRVELNLFVIRGGKEDDQ